MIMSHFLDQYLIVNIVSRLPIESVLRCRCVCKSWRALLHQLYFIQIHTERTLLQQQHIDDHQSPVSFFMLGCVKNTKNYQCHLQDYKRSTRSYGAAIPRYIRANSKCHLQDYYYGVSWSSSSHKIISSPLNPSSSTVLGYSFTIIKWSVIGSINGLICLYGVDISEHLSCPKLKALVIYNPITKEYLNLPADDVVAGDKDYYIKDGQAAAIGFGYHPSTKEYKIVIIIHQGGDRWLHSIYTLGSKGGKWRISKVGVPPAATYQSCSGYGSVAKGTHVNGAIYWLTESHTIVSFDLENEMFRIIHAPHSASCCSKILGGERLCVVCMVRHDSQDIWVMNNNGDQYSWSKEFSMPATLDRGIQRYELIPLGTGAGRDRVVCLGYIDKQKSKLLISFDCRTKTFESLGVIKTRWSFEITCYTKSLVSLKALGEEDAKVLQPSAAAAAATTKTQMIKLFTSFLLHLFYDYS